MVSDGTGYIYIFKPCRKVKPSIVTATRRSQKKDDDCDRTCEINKKGREMAWGIKRGVNNTAECGASAQQRGRGGGKAANKGREQNPGKHRILGGHYDTGDSTVKRAKRDTPKDVRVQPKVDELRGVVRKG